MTDTRYYGDSDTYYSGDDASQEENNKESHRPYSEANTREK